MLHPATAHFAMVLPIVASVFGLIYLFTKTEGMSKISSRTTLFAALAMIGVWYTGNEAGPQIYDYLSVQGKAELVEHKTLGLYLAIAIGIIALLKMAGCKLKNFMLEALAVVLLLAVTATTFLQGKMGGELVYNYGMPFKSYMIEKKLKKASVNAGQTEESDEKVEYYEDAIDEINSLSKKVDKIYGNSEVQAKDKE
ncbi:hypothetical protein SMGD1_1169 [Sulfurimonas gotlandica GD1]|jgi:uncharacterized membrane protein|uniref:DUF2231 domain-containing protein n=2 Tax=Sulfurimonas TaxID=202746 RepID=H1FYZ8_SULGG|nr:hypothetical protein SMGD1_1169 [Sulfurimonas gotlandica GD1]